jgi:hypothetical protein
MTLGSWRRIFTKVPNYSVHLYCPSSVRSDSVEFLSPCGVYILVRCKVTIHRFYPGTYTHTGFAAPVHSVKVNTEKGGKEGQEGSR